MSPTSNSEPKKRIQPKRSASTPSNHSNKTTPKSSKRKIPTNKMSTTTPTKSSKSQSTIRKSGSKRKQPFKLIVARDTESSRKLKKSPLSGTRKKSKKSNLVTLSPRNFRVSIAKRVNVISQLSNTNSPEPEPELDTSILKTPPPKVKEPEPDHDRTLIHLDEMRSIDFAELQQKQDESISLIQSGLNLNIDIGDEKSEKPNRTALNLDHSIMQNRSQVISPTKSFGPIPYISFSKRDHLEDSDDDIELNNNNDISIDDLCLRSDLPNPNTQTIDISSPTLAHVRPSKSIIKNNHATQIVQESNSFTGLDNVYDGISFVQDKQNDINELEDISNLDLCLINNESLNNNPISNPENINLDVNVFDSETNNNEDATYLNNMAPLNPLTNNYLNSATSDKDLPSTNLFAATGFSNTRDQSDAHSHIEDPSNSDNKSFTQTQNIQQS